jgi:hypothetical protein
VSREPVAVASTRSPDAARSTPGARPDEPRRPDPLHFQQASMLLLVFRFRGRRKLVVSRLMESGDFVAELRAHLPVLERLYGELDVAAVDVVSYQHGRFYTDPWPEALAWIERLRGEPGS